MAAYFCPMHPDVRSAGAGKCPVCGMGLAREDARFPLLAHLLGNPLHLAAMVALMLVLMAGAMMLLR